LAFAFSAQAPWEGSMSEFSESLFVRSNTIQSAIDLLRAAGVAGYAFPSENGWVPFAYSRGAHVGDTRNLQSILAANPGELLHYSYAEDHGCWVDLYERDVRVGRLKASFEQQNARFDRGEFLSRRLLTDEGADATEAWVASAHHYDARKKRDEYIVARALGLPRFAWFSYEYELTTDAPDEARIEIDREGRARDRAVALQAEIDDLLATLPPTRRRLSAEAPPQPAQAPKKKVAPKKKASAAKKAPPRKRRR
jgi:hypothetical protein